ncbi:hypothetical protein [Pseudomonas sp. GL-B-19]|uniref:hypothetical protein n=1 Tax=Pseudomonas sp. GL-B-19 TaxID=2832393 RepID=UPI001CBEDF13|nr:hypothetical protein [Pseudomonas sp. GL-B-19]
MSDTVSLFEVIKRGGYEASLITTFNATLPFYEEVLLRRLVAAGCRHNVVLMDQRQCAASWGSEASRPRLAGHNYTLLPIRVSGAFHPKVCLLLGAKKASILIGSHNLTLSGMGFNREVSNWIEVASAKDAEGTAILAAVWSMVKSWIELERDRAPLPLLDSALAMERFISPLIVNAGEMTTTAALAQSPGGPSLLDQLVERVPVGVKRIGVLGAFFDHQLTLMKSLKSRWPDAEVAVGIDPDTVQHPGAIGADIARHVDVRALFSNDGGYLHAKILYFESANAADDVFVSGSANPSRPAWMGEAGDGNVEAVILQTGTAARQAAEATAMQALLELPELAAEMLASLSVSHEANADEGKDDLPMLLGYSSHTGSLIYISCNGAAIEGVTARFFGPNLEVLEAVEAVKCAADTLEVPVSIPPNNIRSCLLLRNGNPVARAMIQHPALLESSARSSKQFQIRSALSELGSSEVDISKIITVVERVIFAPQSEQEVEVALREYTGRAVKTDSTLSPASLAINAEDIVRNKRKVRLLKSGDLAYLLDVLVRRLNDGLEVQAAGLDNAGRSEEEQVGQDDAEEPEIDVKPAISAELVAKAVCARGRTLCRRMVEQLKLAATNESRQVSVLAQLIAVLAILRELRYLEKSDHWRKAGLRLTEEKDRRYLLDHSFKYLLGANGQLLAAFDLAAGEDTDESMQLCTLLVWLAWDLGEALTLDVTRIWDKAEKMAKLQSNAVFLSLMPKIVIDQEARTELHEHLQKTSRDTPEAVSRVDQWLSLHMAYGASWASGFREASDLVLGGYCTVPGVIDEPRVILELDSDRVGYWDFVGVRRFKRDRVLGMKPVDMI